MSKEENLNELFEEKSSLIKKSNLQLDNDTLLTLYGYYKQAIDGDCNINCPGFWDPKGKAKYEAWNQHKSMSKDHAMKRYIKKVNKLLEK